MKYYGEEKVTAQKNILGCYREKMSTKRKSKNMKQCIRNVLNAVLYVEANSSSSVMMYEPKTPKKLSNYRKER